MERPFWLIGMINTLQREDLLGVLSVPDIFIFLILGTKNPASLSRLSIIKSPNVPSDGGDKRDRTADLLNAIQALSQLSYTPVYVKGVHWVI